MKLARRLAAATFVVATSAHANSRLPATNQLVVAPDDPSRLLLRATFGFLFSNDAGQTWDWLCEAAIPYTGQSDPAVALLNGGNVLSGQFEGLAVSLDRGCSWSYVAGTEQGFAVDVARALDGQNAVAITNLYTSTTDAGVLLYDTKLWRTTDTGKSWGAVAATIDPTLAVDTLDIAPSDPSRIYITGQPYGATSAKLLVSTNGGSSYQELDVPFAPDEYGLFITAVDPNLPDRVYFRTLGVVKTSGAIVSRLLVTADAGLHFTSPWSGGKMEGFALSPDGSRVYLGSQTDGLFAANASDLAFTKQSDIAVQCLATSGSTLYVCSNELKEPFVLGATTNEGQSFTPLFKLETIRGPLQCPAQSPASTQCDPLWPALASQFAIDAGTRRTTRVRPHRDAAAARPRRARAEPRGSPRWSPRRSSCAPGA